MITSIYNILQTNLPEEFTVNLNQNDFWTNFLLILNILVSILAATYLSNWTDKKTKKNENKSYLERVKAEKIFNFCLKTNKTFKTICSKNPRDITNKDISELNNIVTSEELMLISEKSENNIRNFRDYIIKIKENPTKKNLNDEKSFIFLLKEMINAL